jgi:hypothetical protein
VQQEKQTVRLSGDMAAIAERLERLENAGAIAES